MSDHQEPVRALGTVDRSDQPYDNEVETLQDAPTERTPLIRNSTSATHQATEPVGVAPAFDNSGNASRAAKRRRQEHARPIVLLLLYIAGCLLLFANIVLLILSLASLRSPIVAAFIPAHFSSGFVPIWLAICGIVTNALTLVAYVFPRELPKVFEVTALIDSVWLFISLILCLAVGQLRRGESSLTFIALALAITSSLHSFAATATTARYAPFLAPPEPIVSFNDEAITVWASIKRAFKGIFAFATVSLPIVVFHLAVSIIILLLTISLILRSYDYSLQAPGQLWKVDPYSRRAGGQRGWINPPGRPYFVHLSCKGVEQDPLFAGASADPTSAPATFDEPPVRRTILLEADQGLPGKPAAAWLTEMLRRGELTSADVSVRVCYWDRPGYGFSQNAPTAAIGHTVAALSQALHLSGELARLSSSASFAEQAEFTLDIFDESAYEEDAAALDNLPPAPPNRPRNGFILVADGYGALLSSVFAAKNARLIHSAVYLNPLVPALRYEKRARAWLHALKYPFVSFLPRLTRELGLRRIAWVIKGTTREQRILSREPKGVTGGQARAWLQESGEGHKGEDGTSSARAWNQAKSRYPNRPTIILRGSGKSHGYADLKWTAAQQGWIDEVIGKGLLREVKDWDGTCPKQGGECRAAVLELVGQSY